MTIKKFQSDVLAFRPSQLTFICCSWLPDASFGPSDLCCCTNTWAPDTWWSWVGLRQFLCLILVKGHICPQWHSFKTMFTLLLESESKSLERLLSEWGFHVPKVPTMISDCHLHPYTARILSLHTLNNLVLLFDIWENWKFILFIQALFPVNDNNKFGFVRSSSWRSLQRIPHRRWSHGKLCWKSPTSTCGADGSMLWGFSRASQTSRFHL